MPLPGNLTLVTVTGTYLDPSGAAASGTVEFQLTAPGIDAGGSAIINVPVVVALIAGHFSVALPATDDSDWSVTGLMYRVTEKLTGVPIRSWYAALPAATPGGTIDVAALAPGVFGPVITSYEITSHRGAINGYASLDGNGWVPLSQLGNVSGAVNPSNTVVSETGYGQGATAGVGNTQSRGDHTHGTPSLTLVGPVPSAPGDTQAVGVASTPAVSDHRHARVVAAPTGQARTTGSAGVLTTDTRSDHAHPLDTPMHTDLGYLAWTMPPWLSGQTTAAPVAGTVYVSRVLIPVAVAIAGTIVMQVTTAGAGLTAGQCFVTLHDAAGVLLGTSADQAANWAGTGRRAASVGAQNLAAGFCFVTWWFNGTTGPRFMAGGNGLAVSNGELSAANSFWATADTGRTNAVSAPNPLGALTAIGQSQWVGIL